MNISMITQSHKNSLMNQAIESTRYDITQGVGSAKIYRVIDGKLIVELDWDQDTDVILTSHK